MVADYHQPLPRATEPFYFNARLPQKELTGLKAANVKELVECLKHVPDSVVFYHTHQFLEEHHFLSPQPPSDFARWVSDALGNEPLAERLAYIDPCDFTNIGSLRGEIIKAIEEYLEANPDLHKAPEGEEFHLVKSISYILPTGYVAYDLGEFVAILRKVSINSLYFHMFEARLRLGMGLNDFSLWLRDCLGEVELASEIERLDTYYYTLEGLRSTIIKLIERHIERRKTRG
jgi:hypothetical protein